MKPTTKLFLKTFLATGVPFGLTMSAIDIFTGEGFMIGKFLFMTFFFGLTMSLFFVYTAKKNLKKQGITEITDEHLKVVQTKYFTSGLNLIELTEKLKASPISQRMKVKEVENGILLQTGASWKSWGEEIRITQKSAREPNYEYQVSSSPRLKTTLVDYGKNLENLNQIERLMNSFG
ncbi:MAG: hypothetical protein AAGI38_24790 [Bacteroidota bacterium]